MSTQKRMGVARAPMIRLRWRKNRTSSRLQRAMAGIRTGLEILATSFCKRFIVHQRGKKLMAAGDALEILWKGESLLAVAKPAGLATIPGRGETDCVVERLSAQLGMPLRLVHRLDKE